MPPSLSSSKKAKPAQLSRPKMIPLLHCNRKTNPFLNNDNNTLLIHLHLAKTVPVHFQIMAKNSNCLQQKTPVPYRRNRDTVYIQNLIRFNQLCLIFFSLQITTQVHEPHSVQFFQKFLIFSHILTQMSFCFLVSVPIRRIYHIFSFQLAFFSY